MPITTKSVKLAKSTESLCSDSTSQDDFKSAALLVTETVRLMPFTYPCLATGDSWKELAKRSPDQGNQAATVLIRRTNERLPFSNATSIFDVGCGSGTLVFLIVEKYGLDIPTSTNILAGDFSEHMLDNVRQTQKARSKEANDIWDRIEVRNVDAHDLSSISAGTISHMVSGMVYFMLPDPRKALREAHRVLCAGGIIGISSGKSSQHIDALCKAVERVRPGTNLELMSGPWHFEDGVKAELEATGFVDVETQVEETSMDYLSHKDLASTLQQMPVIKNATKSFSMDQMTDLEQVIVEELRKVSPDEPGRILGKMIVAVARKPGTMA